MTGTEPEPSGGELASAAVQRATRTLLARQDSRGRWSGRSAGDVTLDAEALLVREFLGVRTPEGTSAAAQQIRSGQQPDGSWIGGAVPDGSADLSASVLAYLALRLAGDSPDAYHLAVAAGWIRDAGGIEALGLVGRSWLATFGLTGWADVHVPVPEFVFLPARYAPASENWAGWSRHAVVSLTIIGTLQPARRLPVDLTELRAGGSASPQPQAGARLALSAAQRTALRKCGQWLVDWQQRAGLPASGRPYWPCSLVALHALGYPLAHPVLSDGLCWLDSATARPRPPARPAAARSGSALAAPPGGSSPAAPAGGVTGRQQLLPAERMPPVRDTAVAVRALADAGLPGSHPALIAAGSWLLAQRIEGPADLAGRRSGPATSGWSFGGDGYPVPADTASVLLTLSRIHLAGLMGKPAITHATRWLIDVQRRDGGWDHSVAATALVVQALATHGAPDAAPLRRGVVWLLRRQLTDGAWPGPGGRPELTVTTMVLPALLVAGVRPGKPAVQNAVCWLVSVQNGDGGWSSAAIAEQPDRPAASDVAGTARAIAVLVAVGGEITEAIERGAAWLVRTQQADGGWSDATASGGRSGHRGERRIAPASRYSHRRRGPLVPALLLPLGALGQFVAAGGVVPAERADRERSPRPVTETGLSSAIGLLR
jgi:squalene-hopene/tetraprenyl-beta-curcumene cyclase